MATKTTEPQKEIKFFTLDTETRGLFGKVFRCGMYTENQYWAFDTFGECYPILKEYAQDYEVHVYIHNLDFDLAKIAESILPDVEFSKCIFIEHNVAIFGLKTDIIFHDSLKLIPSSLEKASKDFGLGQASKIELTDYLIDRGYALNNEGKKLKKNEKINKKKSLGNYFNTVSPDEEMLNIYLKHDCTSLYSIIKQLIDISELGAEEFVKCPTTASLAMKVYKTRYKEDYDTACSTNYFGEYGQFMEQVVRQAYYGGRTEVFIPELVNGFHYDVNSLYPYCMKVNEYPVGYYEVFHDLKAGAVFNLWLKTNKGGGLISCDIHVPEHMNIPPLPHRTFDDKNLKGKLIFPTGNLSGTWAFPEIKMALKYGCTINKISQVMYFKKTAPIFKAFVEQFEALKIEATKKKQDSKRTFAKLMQNSLYGKFGMIRTRRTFVDYMEKAPADHKYGEGQYVSFKHDALELKMLQVETDVKSNYIQPHLAAYVTAYARVLLYEGLMSESNGDVAYCDTDSIACQNEFDPDLVDESVYGKWKLESEIKHAIFLQPKLYSEKLNDGTELIKAKGVPSGTREQMTFKHFEDILHEIKTGKKERIELFGTEDSLFDKEVEGRVKFVTSMKNGSDFDKILYLKKAINVRTVQKRDMDYKNNSSRPHNLIEWGVLIK